MNHDYEKYVTYLNTICPVSKKKQYERKHMGLIPGIDIKVNTLSDWRKITQGTGTKIFNTDRKTKLNLIRRMEGV